MEIQPFLTPGLLSLHPKGESSLRSPRCSEARLTNIPCNPCQEGGKADERFGWADGEIFHFSVTVLAVMAKGFCSEWEILTEIFPQHFPLGSGRSWQHQDNVLTQCQHPALMSPTSSVQAFPNPQKAPPSALCLHPADTQPTEGSAAGTSTGTLWPLLWSWHGQVTSRAGQGSPWAPGDPPSVCQGCSSP